MQSTVVCSIVLYSECSHIVISSMRCPLLSISICGLCGVFLQDGHTPLWMAASEGHSEVVSLLLERGADKEARDFGVSMSPRY